MALGGTVRGKKTTLRAPTEADLVTYARWMADMRVRRAAGVWHEPAMPATWKERLAEATKNDKTVLWSIDAGEALVGMTQIKFDFPPIASGVDVTYFVIDPESWRRGYGSDAALALHRYIFDYLSVRSSDCAVRADNAAALRVAQRLGYGEYARGHAVYYREGAWVDQVCLRLDNETWKERWPAEREYARLDPALLR